MEEEYHIVRFTTISIFYEKTKFMKQPHFSLGKEIYQVTSPPPSKTWSIKKNSQPPPKTSQHCQTEIMVGWFTNFSVHLYKMSLLLRWTDVEKWHYEFMEVFVHRNRWMALWQAKWRLKLKSSIWLPTSIRATQSSPPPNNCSLRNSILNLVKMNARFLLWNHHNLFQNIALE